MIVSALVSGMRFMNGADERLGAHSYPTTTADLIETHGDLEIAFPNGTETLGDVFGRVDESTFETAEEARLMLYSALGDAAIGRKFYSDRDPTRLDEDGPEPVSL